MEAKELIREIIKTGTAEEKRRLFTFNAETAKNLVCKKFKIFSRGMYPRYFKQHSAVFHDEQIRKMIDSYYGLNYLKAAFRGSAKTSLKKLFDVFVLLNDEDGFRKYIKVLTKDGKNSKQIVTDVYNLIVEVQDVFGDVFEQEGDMKREETMSSFTMKNGRKYSAGTVGQTQRGHIQDAYRPDWIWFEDVEDRDSIKSTVVTKGIIDRISEAIDGLSKNGSYFVTCNYISDQGSIQWFMNKPSVEVSITPILERGKPTWDIYTLEDIDKIKKDSDDFYGEYMCDPKRSTNRFFDIDKIEADMLKCAQPISKSAGVNYWLRYKPNHRYGQGSDHSEGIGADSNTLAGFDFTTGELAYTYANNQISPDLATHEFARVGREFGNCIYAPETNAKCGGIAITTLKSINYPNIFRQVNETKIKNIQSDKLGWETNSKTKYNMFYEFRTDYNDGLILIYDVEVLKEMKAYSNSDLSDSVIGLITRHFDLLTAVVIAWQMRKYAQQNSAMKSYNSNYKKYIDSLGK